GYGESVGGPLSNADVDGLIAYLEEGAPAPAAIAAPTPGDAGRGKTVYDQTCATCHGQPDQRGSAVHLANPVFLASASDGFLAYAIMHGRPGTKMDAWEHKLAPAQIADIVTYLRSWRTAAPAQPTATEVPSDLPI